MSLTSSALPSSTVAEAIKCQQLRSLSWFGKQHTRHVAVTPCKHTRLLYMAERLTDHPEVLELVSAVADAVE